MEKKRMSLLKKIIIIVIILVLFVPPSVTLIIDKYSIRGYFKSHYPSYKINDIELSYYSWFWSGYYNADDYHKATNAKVIIQNEREQRTVLFKKFLLIWLLDRDVPDYGPDIPDGFYFVEIKSQVIRYGVDIEEHIKDRKYWIVPDKGGNNYTISKSSNYYSIRYCDNIYKTKDGKVYIFDKEKSNWKVSEKPYSDLVYYGNYQKVKKKYAMEIIEKYSSYKE